MKRIVFFSVVCVFLFSSSMLFAKTIEGNGKIITKTVPVSSYTGIDFGKDIQGSEKGGGWFSGKKKIWPVFNYSQQSGTVGLEITIDENLFSYLDITVSNGILTINAKKGNRIAAKHLVLKGHSENLEYIKLRNGADMNIQTDFTAEKLIIESDGGSDLRIEKQARVGYCELQFGGGGDLFSDHLECNEIVARASGGSDIHLKGKADRANFKASGGSDIKAYDFVVRDMEVVASGGSDIYAHVTGTISGKASGGSDVFYKGKGTGSVRTSGGSDFKRK